MIKNAKYVKTLLIDPDELAKEAQVGVDLTVKKISRIVCNNDTSPGLYNMGTIYNDKEGKKPLFPKYNEIMLKNGYWILEPGSYAIEMSQGLSPLPKDNTAFIYQRSSLGRCGVLIRTSVYDPGYGTPAIGAIMYCWSFIKIQEHSRVAQIIIYENEPTILYNGQYNQLPGLQNT